MAPRFGAQFHSNTINRFLELFNNYEAVQIGVTFASQTRTVNVSTQMLAVNARLNPDDAAYKSSRQQKDLHEVPMIRHLPSSDQLEASRHGIVYIRVGLNPIRRNTLNSGNM